MEFYLGTRLLSVNNSRESIFDLFDSASAMGINGFETAPNYPATNNMTDFRHNEIFIEQWITERQNQNLKLIIRPEAIDNNDEPLLNSHFSFLIMSATYYIDIFPNQIAMLALETPKNVKELEDFIKSVKVLSENNLIAITGNTIKEYSGLAKKHTLESTYIIPAIKFNELMNVINENIYIEVSQNDNFDLLESIEKVNIKPKGIIIQAKDFVNFERIYKEYQNSFTN